MTIPHAGVAIAVSLALSGGCGDNGARCGEGTRDVDGTCTPIAIAMCGEGTALTNGVCAIDPILCEAGTVLIADRCVDPTSALVIDLEESAEPNGLEIAAGVEPSSAPAGVIALAAVGTPFVVHGHLTPFRDADGDGQLDPDVDTYILTIAVPTVLDISVDGVGGVLGGFYAVGDPAGPVPAYERYGISVAGDAAHRRLFLPAAGRYELAIADVRSLGIGHTPPPSAGAGGAAGGPDAEYYASITAVALPAPSQLAITDGTARATGTLAATEVKLFSAVLGGGDASVRDAMSGQAAGSLTVLLADQLAGYDDEVPGSAGGPRSDAEVALPQAAPGAQPVVVVDAVYNAGSAPEPFTLTITQAAAGP